MALDGFTLHFIKQEIASVLPARIDKITMPSRDMLILAVRGVSGNQKILLSSNPNFARLHLTNQKYENPAQAPVVCMLFRKYLQGAKILQISQQDCDRILYFDIECQTELGDTVVRRLVIEIMGKYSNIILCNENGRIIEALRRVSEDMSRVRVVQPGLMYELPDSQNKLNPFTMHASALMQRMEGNRAMLVKFVQQHISGIAKTTAQHLVEFLGYTEHTLINEVNTLDFAQNMCNYYANLQTFYNPCVRVDATQTAADFFAVKPVQYDDSILQAHESVSQILDDFYTNKDVKDKINQKSLYLHKLIQHAIFRCQRRMEQILSVLQNTQAGESDRLYGELINANLYKLNSADKGKSSIVLPNYYDNYQDIAVPLNPELSIKENALLFFKKYKKVKTAQNLAVEQERDCAQELHFLTQIMLDMENAKTTAELDEIKLLLASQGYIKSERKLKKTVSQSKAMQTQMEGITILIGKNSLQNDRITQQANPDEWWLHVQGTPGSHVVVKANNPSEEVLFYAAKLAAFFSSQRQQSSVVVDYTQKKHVKKQAQSAAGLVYYKNFKSFIVKLTEQEKIDFAKLFAVV